MRVARNPLDKRKPKREAERTGKYVSIRTRFPRGPTGPQQRKMERLREEPFDGEVPLAGVVVEGENPGAGGELG